MTPDRDFGFDTRAIHAGQRPDPYTGARAVPIYQTTSYVFEDVESAAAYFNLQEYGNTYSPHHESDGRRARGARGEPRGRSRRGRLRQRPGGAGGGLLHGAAARRSRRRLAGALRRLADAAEAPLPQALGRPRPRRPERSRRLARAREARDQGCSSARRSATRRAPCSTSRPWPRSPPSAVRRSSSTTPSRRRISAGRSTTAPTSSSTRRRSSSAATAPRSAASSSTPAGSTGRTAASRCRRPVARLPRARVPRDLRRLRVPDEAARRDAARPRCGAEPVQRLPLPAGDRDAPPADGPPRRERARALPRSSSPGRRSPPCGTRRCRSRTGRSKYLPRGAGAVFSFDLAGGREAGRRFIEALTLWSHLANVGDAKSLVIHPASTTHRQLSDEELAGAGIGPGTIRLSVGLEDLDDLLWDLDSGLQRRAGDGPMRSSRIVRERAHHRDRRAVAERAAAEPLRRLLPAAPRLPRDPGEPARDRDPRAAELPVARRHPRAVDVVDVFRQPDAVPAIAEEAVAIGAGALWLQFGVISPEGAAIARARRARRRDGSLPEGRARALPRAHALARVQHGPDHRAPGLIASTRASIAVPASTSRVTRSARTTSSPSRLATISSGV